MTVLVYIIGALLVLAGAVFISVGVPIVRLEIGWSEIIGGSVAGSAGFVILALGVVIARVEDLRRAVVGLSMTSVLRDTFAEPAPAWEDRPERTLPPHPLAPAPVAYPADTLPSSLADPEPVVEPEPTLAEAPLHRDEPVAPPLAATRPVLASHPVPDLDEGAPALMPDEDHAPPLPPVEAVPPEALSEPVEDEAPLVPTPLPPPLRPLDPARARPNFLASFLARRSATTAGAERPAPRFERPSVEPTLVPLRSLDEGDTPARTPIDLSSGWGEPEPAHHVPSGMADEPPLDRPPTSEDEAPPPHTPPIPAHDPLMEADSIPGPSFSERYRPEPPGPPPVAEPEELKPVVVGRYNAGSASYIMYSNGMIEVETEGGTHQFASMQELKAFIERRDAAKV